MIQIEYLPIVLTGIGIIVSFFYYANVLRNNTKSRQMQTIWNIQGERGTPNGILRYINAMNMDWKDYDDFHRKYGIDDKPEVFAEWYSFLTRFDDYGYMIKQGFLDIEFMYEINFPSIVYLWYKFKPIIVERRMHSEHSGNELFWFQFIAEELEKFDKDRGVNLNLEKIKKLNNR